MQRVFSMYNTYLTPVQLTQLTAPQAMQTPVQLPPAQQGVRFAGSALGTSPSFVWSCASVEDSHATLGGLCGLDCQHAARASCV